MKTETQSYDLLISHNQIQLRARDFDSALCQWGQVNIAQGALLYEDYVIFDPLPDDTFGAQVHIVFADKFIRDSNAQRCIAVPFKISENKGLVIASATEKFDINLDYTAGNYRLYYEICEGDEIYFRCSFIKTDSPQKAVYIMDDPWGGNSGKALIMGMA